MPHPAAYVGGGRLPSGKGAVIVRVGVGATVCSKDVMVAPCGVNGGVVTRCGWMVVHIIGGIYGWSVGNGLFDDASYDA